MPHAIGFETETLCGECVAIYCVRTVDDELVCPNCGWSKEWANTKND